VKLPFHSLCSCGVNAKASALLQVGSGGVNCWMVHKEAIAQQNISIARSVLCSILFPLPHLRPSSALSRPKIIFERPLPPLTNMPTNQAAWFHSKGGPFTVDEAPMPQLAGDEILIRYICSGSREKHVVLTLAYHVPVLTPSLSIPPTSPSGKAASSLPPCQRPSAVTSPGSSLQSVSRPRNSKSETESLRSRIGRLRTGLTKGAGNCIAPLSRA